MSTAMIEIAPSEADMMFNENNREVYRLHDDGSESLVTSFADITLDGRYGIEGELFGQPYDLYHLIDNLENQVAFEANKDLTDTWTEPYREGYVDGLKQAISTLKETPHERPASSRRVGK